MARIKIEDLPVMEDIDAQETKGILGGGIIIDDKTWNRRRGLRGRRAVQVNKQRRPVGSPGAAPGDFSVGLGLRNLQGEQGGGQKGFTGLE